MDLKSEILNTLATQRCPHCGSPCHLVVARGGVETVVSVRCDNTGCLGGMRVICDSWNPDIQILNRAKDMVANWNRRVGGISTVSMEPLKGE